MSVECICAQVELVILGSFRFVQNFQKFKNFKKSVLYCMNTILYKIKCRKSDELTLTLKIQTFQTQYVSFYTSSESA